MRYVVPSTRVREARRVLSRSESSPFAYLPDGPNSWWSHRLKTVGRSRLPLWFSSTMEWGSDTTGTPAQPLTLLTRVDGVETEWPCFCALPRGTQKSAVRLRLL